MSSVTAAEYIANCVWSSSLASSLLNQAISKAYCNNLISYQKSSNKWQFNLQLLAFSCTRAKILNDFLTALTTLFFRFVAQNTNFKIIHFYLGNYAVYSF